VAHGTLLDLKSQGKIRAIGVPNCTVDQVRKYGSVGPVDTAQEQYISDFPTSPSHNDAAQTFASTS
jgi:diketogulonate reductase-like aldo/keto reductase